MTQAIGPNPVFNTFTLTCMGWGFSVDSLAIDISHRLAGQVVDTTRVERHLFYVREFHQALIKGKETSQDFSFDTDSLVAGELHRAWDAELPTRQILGEKTPEEVIALVDHFDGLDELELRWLLDYLSEVGELLLRLGP